MVNQARLTNDECVNCGGTKPSRARLKRVDDWRQFICPRCESEIANGIVVDDTRQPATPRFPPREYTGYGYTIGDDVSVRRWAVWWTDVGGALLIHGRYANGDRDVAALIKHLYRKTTDGSL
jgi:hypothetical protein